MTHLLTALRDVARLQTESKKFVKGAQDELETYVYKIDFPALLTMLEEAQRVMESMQLMSYPQAIEAAKWLAKYGEQK